MLVVEHRKREVIDKEIEEEQRQRQIYGNQIKKRSEVKSNLEQIMYTATWLRIAAAADHLLVLLPLGIAVKTARSLSPEPRGKLSARGTPRREWKRK